MWPFTRTPLIPADYIDWQFASYAWLLRHCGGYAQFRKTRLVTPTAEFFPDTPLKDHAFAEYIFARVRRLAGMAEWPCVLEAQEDQPPPLEIQPGFVFVNERQAPAGTFHVPRETAVAVITYQPGLARRPMELVATLAHELGHYLTGAAPEEPPGGWEAWELTTDLAAVFLGFGIFVANSSFSFQQFGDALSSGWRSQRQGYLSESSLVFALALFVRLLGGDEELPVRHLKPALGKFYRRALAKLAAHGAQLDELKTIGASGASGASGAPGTSATDATSGVQPVAPPQASSS